LKSRTLSGIHVGGPAMVPIQSTVPNFVGWKLDFDETIRGLLRFAMADPNTSDSVKTGLPVNVAIDGFSLWDSNFTLLTTSLCLPDTSKYAITNTPYFTNL
jgi:hypothetical protein